MIVLDLIWKAIVLGIVEGITEFLPISSTGHLIIAGDILHFKGSFSVMFEVFIQLGAILAVLVYYRKKIFHSFTELAPGQPGFAMWAKIVIAFLPSAVLGFLLNDFIQQRLFSTEIVTIALVLGAVLMIVIEKNNARPKILSVEDITYKQAFLIGVAQCMAMIPGMSRSASTIIGGLLIGLSLSSCAEFSFFLAIPTMLGASFLVLMDGVTNLSSMEWIALATGFIVSFVAALFVIGKFIEFLSKHTLKPFAYYRLALGAVLLVYAFIK